MTREEMWKRRNELARELWKLDCELSTWPKAAPPDAKLIPSMQSTCISGERIEYSPGTTMGFEFLEHK